MLRRPRGAVLYCPQTAVFNRQVQLALENNFTPDLCSVPREQCQTVPVEQCTPGQPSYGK